MVPETVTIFREGISALAAATAAEGELDACIAREVRITILHEIGHHFGLDEDDLEKLGFG